MNSQTLKSCLVIFALLPNLLFAAEGKPSPTNSNPPAASASQIQPLDHIVAVVNDDVITRHDLDERYARAVQQLESRKTPLPPRKILEKQILERMINDRIQLQFAAQTGIRVDAAMLDRAIERIAAQNQMSVEQFRDAISKEGIAFDKFRDDIRNEIILSRLREREVDNKINVTEAEIDAYLEAQAKQGADEEYNTAHILIRIPENATTEQIQAAHAKAQKALDEIRSGADFAQVSASYSDSPNALEGGAMGWRRGSQIPSLFSQAIQTLKPGETSDILRSNNGFHLLKLIDKRGQNKAMIISQTHARHILIKTNEIVSEADAKNRLAQIRERIENGSAKFEDMARQYSDDGSASKGGDLGWLSPGETVPEFERAMNALKPGEISQPIHTPFGYHLIQVLERRDQDVTKERQRLVARQAIRERKIEEAQEEWLRQLRDSAYVEYRDKE
ncbi:molecular chaperone SurA [Sulfuriferula sp. AH1]|uniref:peptidylprolyl isomerase n=1 Tax=Sulfuriferula sp. AH1 TaxID=1985873 RepID=UPI000B3B18E7|nr:peptidylprolyl isomerase [Sulfuriferula sp. AH1]ARU30564.1 molecular chaperone SurA [Sulfuriferula sp. AH1]